MPPRPATISDHCDGTGASAGATSSMPLFSPFVLGVSLVSAGVCAGGDGADSVGFSPFISADSLFAFSLASLLLLGVTPLLFLGGVLASTFSCVFCDEL